MGIKTERYRNWLVQKRILAFSVFFKVLDDNPFEQLLVPLKIPPYFKFLIHLGQVLMWTKYTNIYLNECGHLGIPCLGSRCYY